jgi:hypothetical protein
MPQRPSLGAMALLSWGLVLAVGSGGCVLQRGLSRQLRQRRYGGHALGREDPAALELPVLVLLQQPGTHQAGDRRVVGEDPHHAGTAFDPGCPTHLGPEIHVTASSSV